MTLREEIEAYLATFHEGADQQRYHLENFMRWRESQSNPAQYELEAWIHKEFEDFKAANPNARPFDVAMNVVGPILRKSNEQMLRMNELFAKGRGGAD